MPCVDSEPPSLRRSSATRTDVPTLAGLWRRGTPRTGDGARSRAAEVSGLPCPRLKRQRWPSVAATAASRALRKQEDFPAARSGPQQVQGNRGGPCPYASPQPGMAGARERRGWLPFRVRDLGASDGSAPRSQLLRGLHGRPIA